MSDREFRELIDLYLDNEIDGVSIQRLREIIAADEGRRREFEAACQLHHAMRLALGKEVAANKARNPLPLRRWLVTAGMAASFVLGGFFLAPAFNETGEVNPSDLEVSRALNRSGSLHFMDNLPLALQRQLARISSGQGDEMSSSLASRLRLAGLSPELEPPDANLKKVRMDKRHIQLTWDGSSGSWQIRSQSFHFFTPKVGSSLEQAPVPVFPGEARPKPASSNALAGDPFCLEVVPLGWKLD